jgi:ABC-2 type transport system permease protein
MTTATSLSTDDMGPNLVSRNDAALPTSQFAACWTLYLLTLRQHLHGRRWIAAALLFLLPAGMAIIIRLTGTGVPSLFLEFVLLWILVPQALLPLVALLYASGIVQDEQEDQTITYLLVRPISKPLIYVVKMAATWTTTVLLVVALTIFTYSAIYAGAAVEITTTTSRCIKTATILSLAAIAYCSIFGAISLLTKRTLIVGILYTAIVEGLLASLPLSLRWGTIIYYTRIMAYRTLDFVVTWPRGRQDDVAAAAWFLNTETDPTLAEHPQLSTCVLIMVSASLAFTLLAAWLCTLREFHVKTPEKE